MNKIYRMKYFLLFLLLNISSIYFFAACNSVGEVPNCINKLSSDAELSWGTLINGEVDTSYTLNMKGHIAFNKNTDNEFSIIVDVDTLCSIVAETNKLILEVQTLNVPADRNLFIEYQSPQRGFYFRALWDPKFTTTSNEKFAKLYDILVNITK